ncbi:MAG: hypothetical protein ACP6IY_09715 [Promethearchaeia archaeon]
MKGKYLIIFFFSIIIIGGLILYIFYEKPSNEIIQNYIDLTIAAKDINNKYVKTNYEVYVDGNLFKSGETSQNSFILYKVLPNKTIKIINKNIENQTYYTTTKILSTYNFTKSVIRGELILYNYSTLNITNFNFRKDKIYVNASVDNDYSDSIICLDWSNKFVIIKLLNFSNAEKVNNNKKCYLIEDNILKNKNNRLVFEYFNFGVLDDRDFMNLEIYYKEKEGYNKYNYNLIQREVINYSLNTKII